jgi:hypothetical protein
MEDKAESFIERNKNAIGLAVGGALLAAAGYFYFSNQGYPEGEEEIKVERITTNQQLTGPPATTATTATSEYQNKIKVLTQAVQKDLRNGELDMQTIMLIHEALMDITEKEFGQLILDNRQQRRAVRGINNAEYEALVVKGAEEIEKLISSKIAIVLVDCGCTMAIYEKSCQNWANKNPQFAMMSILMIERMKTKIPSKADKSLLTLENAKKMMRFQIAEYPKISLQCSNPQVTPLVKQSWLGDISAEEFGFEEEDITTIPGLTMDHEIRQLAQQLQTQMQMDAFSAMGGRM